MKSKMLLALWLTSALTSVAALAACNAPASPADTERRSAEQAQLDHAFLIVQEDENDSLLTIERDGAEVWRIESFLVSAGPIRDLTADGRPNVLIHEAATVSDRALHLLDLPPEGAVSVIWTLSGHASRFHHVESQVYERIEAGESIAQPPQAAAHDDPADPLDAFDMKFDAVENGQDAAEPVSGYRLALTEPDRRLAVSLNGVVIWQSDHTVIAHHGPAEPDAAGVSRLLVHEAVSRSVRRLQVLALEGESARPVWAAQGMASEMTPRFDEIAAALDAGAFDPAAFDTPGASEIDPHGFGLPAAPGEDIGLSESVPVDTPALEAAIAAMGYQILTGEEAEAQDMTIAVMQHGERVWGVRAMMLGHYSLAPSDTPGAVDLLVEVRETRRYGTDYRLRLAADGLTVISETDGGVTGFQPPRDPQGG